MKPAKKISSSNSKLAGVTEFSKRKEVLNLPLSPNPKENRGAKSVRDKIEPMVLRSPPTGESVVRYALPIPSSKTKELIAEDEMIRKITKHLKMVVSTLEESYGSSESRAKPVVKPGEKDLPLSVGDDMNSFLVNCSQFAVQLEQAVKEERNILESLFKWFQRQVNQMEELSKDYSPLEADLLVPEKTVTLNISKVVTQMQKLEELKNQLTQRPKYSLKDTPIDNKENLPVSAESCENIRQKIEEFIKTHSIEDVLDVSETETDTASVTKRLNVVLKVFENQSNMLKRAISDQGLLEAKYKQIENDFKLLSEEKSVLENELQKLKDTEKKHTYDRTKKTVKAEKKKDKEKSEDSERKLPHSSQLKVKEDLVQVQKRADALETENKVLQGQLKQALQEAERSKLQLDHFLKQGVEFLKSEGKTKTMEMRSDKAQGELSKMMPLDRETRAAFVSNSGGQMTNDIIQEISVVQNQRPIEESSEKKRSSSAISDLSQTLNSQDKSAFLEISNEVSTDEVLPHTSPSDNHDNLLTMESSSKENQESLSVETLPYEKETGTSSFISPPALIEGDTKADISGEKLQRETQNQAAGEFEAPYEVSSENLRLEKKDSGSEGQVPDIQQSKVSLVIEALPKDMVLASRKKSETENDEVTRNENFHDLDEEPDENLVFELQDSITETKVKKKKTPKRERFISHDEISEENLTPELPKSMSKNKLQKTKKQVTSQGERTTTPNEEPDEMQAKKQRTSKRERLPNADEVPDEKLEHHDSKLEMQVKKFKTSGEESYNTHDEVPYEDLLPKDQDSVPKIQVQSKKQKTFRGEGLNNQELVPMADESPLPGDSKSKDHPQSKKRKIAQEETLEQDLDGSFKLKDLGSSTGHMNQTQGNRAFQSEKLRTKYESSLELPDTSENLPKLKPSISDIIVQLDLDKVVETDPEQLKSALKQHLLKGEFETPPVNLPDTDLEYLGDGFKHLLKRESKTLTMDIPGTDKDGLTRTVERSKRKNEFKIQVKNPPETDTKYLTDIRGKGLIIKDEMKTKLKSHLETDIEHLTETIGSDTEKQSIKKKLKIHPSVNLSKGKDMLTQEDSFVKHTALSKSLTKSPMDNQVLEVGKPMANLLPEGVSGMSLHKGKDTFTHQEDTRTKRIIPTKFPTKMITLSPFQNKEENHKDLLSYMIEPLKIIRRTSRTDTSITKSTPFPSLNQPPSGKPKTINLSKKSVELPGVQPFVTSAPKNLSHKELFSTVWNELEPLRP